MTVLAHNCRRTAPLLWPNWDPPVLDNHFSTCSFHPGLRHNDGRPAPQRQHMWCISFKLILNSIRTMWKNERKVGETTGNLKSAGGSWICETDFTLYSK
jgi:hypothetical protein